jgi:hypothetical protein
VEVEVAVDPDVGGDRDLRAGAVRGPGEQVRREADPELEVVDGQREVVAGDHLHVEDADPTAAAQHERERVGAGERER